MLRICTCVFFCLVFLLLWEGFNQFTPDSHWFVQTSVCFYRKKSWFQFLSTHFWNIVTPYLTTGLFPFLLTSDFLTFLVSIKRNSGMKWVLSRLIKIGFMLTMISPSVLFLDKMRPVIWVVASLLFLQLIISSC